MPARYRRAKHLLAALCAYEAAAIWTGAVPTVTSHCHRVRVTRGRGLVWAAVLGFAGWLVWHLLWERD